MIKNILFVATAFVSLNLSAQTFDFMGTNDVSLPANHAEYGNGNYLSSTKFHVENLTGASASLTVDVQELVNPTGLNLQVCYGTACYEGTAGVSTVQQIGDAALVASGAIYDSLKVAPFAFGWSTGDSAVWKVIIRNVATPTDTVVSIIKWKNGSPTSVERVLSEDVVLSAYPNPATDNLTVKYNVKGSANNIVLNVYDVLGKEIVSRRLSSTKGTEVLNTNEMNSGVYFYAIKVAGEAVKTERFIVR
ncbi:MAG: T9SS type A sorting domain-containing protein [Vicingaceae bacterium]|nr:T9SS type A sorting domain-containing protein [Vicingaceae bacterium]